MTTGTLPNPKHCLNDIQTTLRFRLLGGLSEETADEIIESNFEEYQAALEPMENAHLALLDEIEFYLENLQK